MIYNGELKDSLIILRPLTFADCQDYYLNWLNDKEVNQYLETRWNSQSIETIKDFVTSVNESSHSYLFAIIYNKHIGNIKIGPIHPIYKYADISYFIGEKTAWGKGIASRAINLVTDFAFTKLNLNRVEAGAFEQNIGSQKALLKNGFKQEALYRKKAFLQKDDDYCDLYKYAVLKNEWRKNIKEAV